MSLAIGSYSEDEDDLIKRASALQGLGGVNYTPPSIQIPAPGGLSPLSSIGSAPKKEAIPQHRPALEEPRNITLRLIDVTIAEQDLSARRTDLLNTEVAEFRADQTRLEAEDNEKLAQKARDANSQGSWDTFSMVTQYTLGALTIGAGIYTGGLPGYLLVASGVIGVGNQALHHSKLLPSAVAWLTKSAELQRKITLAIDIGALTLQMGLGLAGGFMNQGAKAATAYATSALSVAQAGTKVGSEYYKKRIADTNSELTKIRYQITANNHELNRAATEAKKALEQPTALAEVTKSAIRARQVSMD